MIGMSVSFNASRVMRALRQVPDRMRKATAQELNTQRNQSKSRMTKRLSRRLGVKPQKRIRRRLLLPKGGRASPRNLVATGLSLVETMPARWFARGKRGRGGGFNLDIPGGTQIRPPPKPVTGGMFQATMRRSGRQGVFRRVDPPRTRQGPQGGRTSLPIQEVMVDTRRPAYRIRLRVLAGLAREWPDRWQRRMRRELRRIFRGV